MVLIFGNYMRLNGNKITMAYNLLRSMSNILEKAMKLLFSSFEQTALI